MKLTTTFIALEKPEIVFSAFHQYKRRKNPASFFPSLFVKWQFRVLSENTLGIGATYDWKIRLLGFPMLVFQEKVVEWQEGESVAYRAIQGWEMDFRVDLQPDGEGTLVSVYTDLALPGPAFIHSLLRPAYEWGLQKVCMRGLRKEGIGTHV
jgi:hypothetical protein